MRSLLLRRLTWLPGLLLTVLLGTLAQPAAASHLLGGEARFRYLGTSTTPGRPFRYELTFSIYVNCDGPPGTPGGSQVPFGRAGIGVRIYDKATGQQIPDPDNPGGTVLPGTHIMIGTFDADPDSPIQGTLFPIARDTTDPAIITPPPPPGCSITAGCVRLVTYTRTVDLPVSVAGYYATYSDVARNNTVTNIDNPGSKAQFLYVFMPSPLLPNRSPVFSDTAVVLVCAGADTVTLINNAFDPDGDRLTYDFYTPYDQPVGNPTTFVPPPPGVDYEVGYSLAQPFGAGGYAYINSSTGLTRYFVPNDGDYVVGVRASEHRTINGQDSVISSTLREIQLKVRQCANQPAPTLQFAGGQTTISIEEGSTAQFSATATVVAGNPIRLSAASPLLDGPGGFNATFNSSQGTAPNQAVVVTGTTTLTGTFSFSSTCGSAGIYNVNLAARDQQGCPIKTTSIPYVITVRRPTAPTRIAGDSTLCPNSTATYTAVGAPTGTTTYQWTVTGGTIQGAATGATITVLWSAPGTGTVSVKAVSPMGCPSDATVQSVEVFAGVTATMSGLSPAYCLNPTAPGVTLTGSPAGGTFTITGAGGNTNLVNGVFTPRVPGTFQVSYTLTNPNGCSAVSVPFTVVVNPLPTVVLANTLAPAYCQNDPAVTLTGTVNGVAVSAANGSFTIDGQPATVFDPATLAPGPHVVALLGTGVGGCQTTISRTVTVNTVPAVLLTGLQTSYCKNAAPVTLTATANGTPITGANALFTIDATPATQLNPQNLTVGFHIIRVTGLGTNGCRDTDSLQVEIKPLPVAAITNLNPAYCKDEAPVTLSGTLDGTPGGSFTIDGTPATVLNPATLSVGTHTVVFSGTGLNGCANSATQTVVINALPAVTITAPTANVFCQDALPVTLQGNLPGSFTIDGTPATVLNPATLTPGQHIVQYSGTSAATGCSNTTTLTITINALPTVALTGLQAAYCKDAAPVTLTALVNGSAATTGNGAFTIDGTPATVLNPATLSVGTHTVEFIGTVAGCENITTQLVVINALPTVAFTGLNPAYCQGTPAVALAATVNGAAGNVTFTIDGTPATTFDPTTLPLGTHTVVATGTDTTTCVNSVTQTVTINALPTVGITGLNAVYCQSAPAVALTGTVNGGTGTLAFTINGTPATSFDPTTLGPGTYTVVATGTITATGCQNTTTQTVVVNPLPTVTIIGLSTAYCQGAAPVTLGGTVSGSGAITFTVNGQPTSVFDPATLAPGTYTVIATGTDPNGCQNTTTQTVVINALPTVIFTGLNPAYCQSATAVTLAATVNGGAGTVTFTIDGAPATTLDPATLPLGTHTVVATGTDGNTCVNTVTQTVTINALPAVTITNLQPSYCVNAVGTALTGTVNGAGGTISFTINGTPATAFNPATLGAGTYTVVATGTDGNTCQNTATQTVTVVPLPTVVLTGLNASYCQGAAAVPLTATVNGGPGTVTFTINGSPATAFDPATLAPGTYTVAVTGTDGSGCEQTTLQLVTILALPSVAITNLQPTYCASAPAVTLAATVSNGGTATFTIDGTPATTLDPATLTPGVHTVVATGVDPNTCQNTATQTVTINALPNVQAAASTAVICQGESVTLTATGATTYSWTDGTNTFTGASLTLSPTVNTTYTVTGTDGNTCVNTSTVMVTVNPKPAGDIFTGPLSVCPGLTGVTYSVTSPNFMTYRWVVNGGTINGPNTGSSVTVDWGPANANASVKLVSIADPTGCPSDTITVAVTVNQVLLTQTPTGIPSVCVNAGPQTFQIPTPSPGSTYSWALTGSATAGPITGDGTPTITVEFTQPGTATLVVTETSSTPLANCFGQSQPFNVTVLPAPDATLAIQGPATTCADGAPLSFTLAGGTGSTYVWTLNGSPQPATGSSFTVNPTTAGTYTIGVQETNAVGCVGPVITSQLVANPVPATTAVGPTFVCGGQLTNQTITAAGLPGSTFQWTVTGGTITSGQGNDTITVDFDGTVPPQVNVVETTTAGCVGQSIVFAPSYDISAVALNLATVNEQNPTALNLDLHVGNPPANASQVQILRRDLNSTTFTTVGTVPASNTNTIFTDPSADVNATAYVYRLDYLNACSTVLQSNEHQTVHLTAAANETTGDVTLTWNAYKGLTERGYEVLRGTDVAGIYEVLATITDPAQTSYVARGIGRDAFTQAFRIRALLGPDFGITRTSYSNEAKVQFQNEVKGYNIITPDGDGLNDTFVVENAALYPNNELIVFNRWGREVFRKTNYDNSWNAEGLAAGTYYYQFTTSGKTFKAWVEVVR